jgi:hypothetical protein
MPLTKFYSNLFLSFFCGINFSVQSQVILCDGVPAASGFYARALTMRGLSTVGNAEVASSEDDSSSTAVEHPPRIKFKRPDKTARHIMNVSLVLLAQTVQLSNVQELS